VLRRRSLWLLAALAVLGWALALSEPSRGGKPDPASAASTPAEPEPEPAPASEPTPAPKPPTAERTLTPERPEPARVARADSDGADRGQDLAQAADSTRTAMVERAEALRAVNDERWEGARERFDREKRQPGWADGRERAVRAALEEQGADGLLVQIECRATVCRLELSLGSGHSVLDRATSARLSMVLGNDSTARLTGPPTERAVVLYSARDGYPLEPPQSAPE
jgi:hypothetical protein